MGNAFKLDMKAGKRNSSLLHNAMAVWNKANKVPLPPAIPPHSGLAVCALSLALQGGGKGNSKPHEQAAVVQPAKQTPKGGGGKALGKKGNGGKGQKRPWYSLRCLHCVPCVLRSHAAHLRQEISQIECYNCNQKGHFASKCPKLA